MSLQHIAEVRKVHIIYVAYEIMIIRLILTYLLSLAIGGSSPPTAKPTSKPTDKPSRGPTQGTHVQLKLDVAAIRAEGLDIFAMAKAIPGLQNIGAPFELCFHLHHHLYYFIYLQTDMAHLLSQRTSFLNTIMALISVP